MQAKAGFQILSDERQILTEGITKKQLARKFQLMTDMDLSTAGALFVSAKEILQHE
jgi:hypothetical protein